MQVLMLWCILKPGIQNPLLSFYCVYELVSVGGDGVPGQYWCCLKYPHLKTCSLLPSVPCAVVQKEESVHGLSLLPPSAAGCGSKQMLDV